MNTSYGQITLSKVNDGLDAIGLGMKVNYSTLTKVDNGECYFHGYNDQNEPVDVDGWVMWNGAKLTVEHGAWINPGTVAPLNTIILHVYRASGSSVGLRHCDVWWDASTGKWMGYNYSGSNKSPAGKAEWTWNEATDCILATYVEPSDEGKIVSAQLFNPPKKFSELPDPRVGFNLENLDFGGRNMFLKAPRNYSPTSYGAYDINLTELPVAGEKYTVQLWDVDVYNSSKTAGDTGVDIYWGSGSLRLMWWHGTEFFTYVDDPDNPHYHADYLEKTITITQAQADHANAKNKWFRVYNSVMNVDGTRYMHIGKWKMEKGDKATYWSLAPEDADEGIAKAQHDIDTLEIGGRNFAFNTEGIMYSAIKSEDEDPAVAGDEYCAIDLGRTLPLNDGDAVTVSFDLHMLINTASKAHLQVYNTTQLGTHIIVQSVDVLAGRTFKAGDEINERIIITDTVKTRGVDDVQLGTDWLEFDSGNGTSNWYSISNLKVEAGNRATTWTKAPEDVDDDIGATNNRVDEVQGNIEDIKKTYKDFKEDVNNAFQSADEKADRIAQLANGFDGKYAEKFDELYNYIRFVVPEQGQTDDIFSGVELGPLAGDGESSVQLRVGTVVESGTATNCISFVRGGQRLGWWDGVDFYTGNIKVKVSQRAQFGIFAFIPRSGGSLSFKKVQEPEDIV